MRPFSTRASRTSASRFTESKWYPLGSGGSVLYVDANSGSEERYHSLYMGVPVGLFRTSAAGQMLDANLALATLLGYDSADDIIGTDTVDWYVDPADRERWRLVLNNELNI